MPEHSGVNWWSTGLVQDDQGDWLAAVQYDTGRLFRVKILALPGVDVHASIVAAVHADIDNDRRNRAR